MKAVEINGIILGAEVLFNKSIFHWLIQSNVERKTFSSVCAFFILSSPVAFTKIQRKNVVFILNR